MLRRRCCGVTSQRRATTIWRPQKRECSPSLARNAFATGVPRVSQRRGYRAIPILIIRQAIMPNQKNLLDEKVASVLDDFTEWLARYGETSRDHQTFFAGANGQAAKALYYRHKLLGMAAVAPMIFFEAFLPSARQFFHRPTRFPIADAHYAMGFAFLFQV